MAGLMGVMTFKRPQDPSFQAFSWVMFSGGPVHKVSSVEEKEERPKGGGLLLILTSMAGGRGFRYQNHGGNFLSLRREVQRGWSGHMGKQVYPGRPPRSFWWIPSGLSQLHSLCDWRGSPGRSASYFLSFCLLASKMSPLEPFLSRCNSSIYPLRDLRVHGAGILFTCPGSEVNTTLVQDWRALDWICLCPQVI